MDDVNTTGAHAKPAASHDHQWVLAIIAVAVLAEVWASWVGIGATSGFPRIDRIPTDWVLAVAVEAYWGYALFAWLAAAPGPRSRAMAMWSCAVVFVLSLVSQVSYHELTAPAGASTGRRFVIGFASALPVIILALIAVLIHLRHLDRADAAEAGERSAVQAEMDALRGQVVQLQSDLETAVSAHADAEQRASEALTRAETLAQKLAALTAQRRRGKSTPGARTGSGESDPTNELRALMELRANPELMQPRKGGDLARALVVSPATGRRLHTKLVADGSLTSYAQSLTGPAGERSAGPSDERSGDRS